MAQPYSTTAQVLNRVLTALVAQAGWSSTELTGDVAARIGEGDREIDARLAGLEVTLPFATNPPILQDLSVLYARYACFRDLFISGDPSEKGPAAAQYLEQFEKKFKAIQDGWMKILDTNSAQVASTKFATMTIEYPADAAGGDQYPNYPSGPYPDPPELSQ